MNKKKSGKTVIFFFLALNLVNSADLFQEYYKKAEKILSKMTIEQKVGQMFLTRFDKETEDYDIINKFAGGFVLFGKDFNEEDDKFLENIRHIQNLSQNISGLPLGLAVDEEGGTVNRISRHKRDTPFPSPQEIYNNSGIEGILSIEKEKRDLLIKFGMNINLAPVADISYNSSDYIYDRTLGKKPEETAQYIKNEVREYVRDLFSCCTKHFPGYGNNLNTHTDVAYDERPYEQFQKEDLLAFKASIEEKIPMILVSHNIVLCKDKNYPASISKIWHDILRNELNYSGLILTDDLSMDAIKKYSGGISPAVLAVNAGNDILLTSDYYEHFDAILESVKNGTIKEETINKGARRVIAWKLKYLLNEQPEKNDKNEENEKFPFFLIICPIVSVLLLIIALILVKIFCCKVKKESDEKLEIMDMNQSEKVTN